MRVESRIFEILTVFFFAFAVIYGLWSGGEAVGTTGLTLTGGLTLIVGTYFGFVSRRVRMRPEDNAEAEISDGAGELLAARYRAGSRPGRLRRRVLRDLADRGRVRADHHHCLWARVRVPPGCRSAVRRTPC